MSVLNHERYEGTSELLLWAPTVWALHKGVQLRYQAGAEVQTPTPGQPVFTKKKQAFKNPSLWLPWWRSG